MEINQKWLYNQYINLEKSERQIAEENNITREKVRYWRIKYNIIPHKKNEYNSGFFKKGHKPWHTGKNGYDNKVPIWKDWDDLSICTRHLRMYNLKQKPIYCEICNKKKKLQLSNKNHKYSKDINDWQWICQSCHYKHDVKNGLKRYNGEIIC